MQNHFFGARTRESDRVPPTQKLNCVLVSHLDASSPSCPLFYSSDTLTRHSALSWLGMSECDKRDLKLDDLREGTSGDLMVVGLRVEVHVHVFF